MCPLPTGERSSRQPCRVVFRLALFIVQQNVLLLNKLVDDKVNTYKKLLAMSLNKN